MEITVFVKVNQMVKSDLITDNYYKGYCEMKLQDNASLMDIISVFKLDNQDIIAIIQNAVVKDSYHLKDGDRIYLLPLITGG